MESAKGNGQSECSNCKKLGKWSLTWTSFLYKTKNDDRLFCYECAKKFEELFNSEDEENIDI